MGLNFAYALAAPKSASNITVMSDGTTSAKKKTTVTEPLPGQIHHFVRRYGSKLTRSKSNERKNRFKQYTTTESKEDTSVGEQQFLNDPYLEPPQNQKPHHRPTGSSDDTKKFGSLIDPRKTITLGNVSSKEIITAQRV